MLPQTGLEHLMKATKYGNDHKALLLLMFYLLNGFNLLATVNQ